MYRTRHRRPASPGLALFGGLLLGCSFEHGIASTADDASTLPVPDALVDARVIDASADTPPDASPDASLTVGCPAAPTDCTLFACAASPDSCYYYCPTAVSFSTASSRCAAIDDAGCLVTLNDAGEDTCVRQAAGMGSLIYIGLVQSSSAAEPAGGWGWSCGTSTYGPNWSGSEPNNSGFGGEDCGAMDTGGGWVDVGCGEQFRYLCEVPRPMD